MKKEQLLEAMAEAIEVKNQKELDYIIAKKEAEEAIEAYRSYDEMATEIYCGDEITAELFSNALGALGFDKCEIFTLDGEYYVEVRGAAK